jgi:hypothetical protein
MLTVNITGSWDVAPYGLVDIYVSKEPAPFIFWLKCRIEEIFYPEDGNTLQAATTYVELSRFIVPILLFVVKLLISRQRGGMTN